MASILKILAPNTAQILPLTGKDIDDLLAFLPVFNNPEFGAYSFEVDGYNVTRIKYHPSVTAFCNLASQACWYSDYNPLVVDEIFRNGNLLSNATLEQVKAMLTYFVCGERFSDGFQAQLIESKHVQRLLERIKQLRNTI